MEKKAIFTYNGKAYQTVIREEQDYLLVYSLSDDWMYIESIVVFPDRRNQGIGERAITELLERYADKDVYLFATGELGGDEVRLKKWYRRHGFVMERDRNVLPFNYNLMLKRA